MGALSFTHVKGLKPKRNNFNKSHGVSFPGKMGLLMPVMTDFLMPGSYARLSDSLHTRTLALVSPIMDTINTYVHYWNVPIRLIDPKFKQFIGNEIDPDEYNPVYYTPRNFTNALNDIDKENIPGYDELFTLPYGESVLMPFSALTDLVLDESVFNSSLLEMLGYNGSPEYWKNGLDSINLYEFKAYILLLKHWYTNENITIHFPCYATVRGEEYTGKDDHMWSAIDDFMTLEGDQSVAFAAFYLDMVGNFGMKAHFTHGWSKDYFTSALPNTQYGDSVKLPLGGTAPVTITRRAPDGSINTIGIQSDSSTVGISVEGQGVLELNNEPIYAVGIDGHGTLNANTSGITQISGKVSDDTNLQGIADLSEATAIDIIELRIAETFQLFKERIQRAGRRYREYLKMFFNVVSSDATLQDPQWLGGGKVPLNVADIPQTSATDGVTPQGNLAGKATQFGQNFSGFRFYTEEWCIVIGVAYMQPVARYVGGIERNKLKTNDIYDWFNPTFEHIGEQPIKLVELYAAAGVTPDETFGYQRRYAEYTFKNDRMCGAFKNSLSHWTAGLRIFDSKPALNQQFIYVQPDAFDRIFAVSDENNDGNVLFWWYHNYVVKQPQSKFGTPGLHV